MEMRGLMSFSFKAKHITVADISVINSATSAIVMCSAPREKPAAYQLVGKVTAYQGYDG